MGQREVLRFLEKQRNRTDRWYRVNEIKEGMEKQGYSNGVLKGIHSDLLRLHLYSMIEMRGVGIWRHHKEYRAYFDTPK